MQAAEEVERITECCDVLTALVGLKARFSPSKRLVRGFRPLLGYETSSAHDAGYLE
jgi:hypothetical protein